MKREKDGYYYEKIVNYKKNQEPNIYKAMAFVVMGVGIGILLGWLSPKPENLGLTVMVCFGLTILFFILNYFITHDRNVKLRRLGK